MAHFYGEMQGSRGNTTRCGTKASGITAHVRGWDAGVRVTMEEQGDGRDCAFVDVTGGSNSPERVAGTRITADALESLKAGTHVLVVIPFEAEDVD